MENELSVYENENVTVELIGLNRYLITYPLDKLDMIEKDMQHYSNYGSVKEVFIDNGYGFEFKANTIIDWGE